MSFLYCLPFANRASDSGDLYIDFNRNHLIYPVACLVCQDYALFILVFPEHAYALHITSRISCHVFASCCLRIASWLILVPLLILLSWVEPGDEYVNEEPVENAYEDQAFDNSENLAGKMIIPSKSLLSLLARLLALLLCPCCDTYHLLYHASYITLSAPNHPCPSKPLFGYVTALLSPSYSVASCR